MIFLINTLLLIGAIYPTFLDAKIIGKIIKLRGKVTVLQPHKVAEVAASKGMAVAEETSISTQEKSFAVVEYRTGSKLTIGPKSMVVLLPMGKQKSGIVNLLTGKLKARVTKKPSKSGDKKHHFIIKTKTAAMGVRGTDFQTTYNAENEVTSLLVFGGKVAMAKIDPKEVAKIVDQALLSKNAVLVKIGHFSGVSNNSKMASGPVKISPTQFTRLKLNDTFLKGKISDEKFKKELSKTEKTFASMKSDEETERGAKDNLTGRVRPTSGGYIDLESSLYIAPNAHAKFDKKVNVFSISEDKGDIKNDGNYTPPRGTLLDAKRGFVVDKSIPDSNTLERVKKLNEAIAGQIVKPKKAVKSELQDIKDLENDAYDKYFQVPE